MIVQNNHQTYICKCLDGYIEDFDGCFSDEFWVGLEVLGLNDLIIIEKLQGVGESDAVHLELVSDVVGDIAHWPALQPVHAFTAQVTARPVSAGQLDPPSCLVDNLDAAGGKRKLYVLDVEENGLLDEVQDVFVVSSHEGLVGSLIDHVSHGSYYMIDTIFASKID